VSTLLRQVEVDGVEVDVLLDRAVVARLAPPGTLTGADEVIAGGGGALMPGLHDHHIHLMALAAALGSVDVHGDLDAALSDAHRRLPPGRWIRAVGHHEGADGPLDRWRLDSLAPGRAVRVQHRSGSMWVLSSAALDHVGAQDSDEPGVERDGDGRPTGRVFRLDDWLRVRTPRDPLPDLASVGHRLASYGVTGVTDCTATTSLDHMEMLAAAVQDGALPLHVAVTGGPELSECIPPGAVRQGPVKIVIADHQLPDLEILMGWIHRAHQVPRPVAVHCVTREALVLVLAAWREVGSLPGDRIEHAAVTPPELIPALAGLGIAVVTQPAFIGTRGDDYRRQVEPDDVTDLYRCASFLRAGVPVGGSTDAPFGPDDPWLAIRAAVERRTPEGAILGPDERITAAAALRLHLAPLDQVGGPARRVQPGSPADLCLLDGPLRRALADPSSRHVAMTMKSGTCTYRSGPG
jgi:predicted amidohydrolase YtcJ